MRSEADPPSTGSIIPPRVSVCIATYNRAHFIGPTLESILGQLQDDVEIVVVDGASPDETPDVVRKYEAQCPQLRYVRLPAKGGVDQDYDKAVELARGEYCWLFSDDDVLKPGAVAAVLAALDYDYTLIVVNAEVRNADLSKCLAERKLKVDLDCTYLDTPHDRERFLADVADYLTFIGGVVIRRDLWLSRDRSRYYGSRFIHVGVIFQNGLPGRKLVMATPWIQIRLGKAEWAMHGFEIWMFKWPDLIWSFDGYSDATKESVCRRHPWRQLRTLMYYRAIAAYSSTEYQRFILHRLKPGCHRALARLIAYLPNRPVNILLSGYARLRRNEMLAYIVQDSRQMPIDSRLGRILAGGEAR